MKELLSAIYSHFNGENDLHTSLGGQMYPHEADAEATFPYCVYYQISDFFDEDFSDETESLMIQFSLFSDENSPSEILDLAAELKSLFDGAKLDVEGYRLLSFSRQNAFPVRDAEMGTWSYIIEYEALLERTK